MRSWPRSSRSTSLPAARSSTSARARARSLALARPRLSRDGLDVDSSRFTNNTIPFQVLDINKGIAASIDQLFDAVCCIEVIEHVENPWQVMRDSGVTKPGASLSSPRPRLEFPLRLHFLRTGDFYNFGPQYLEMGHINPIHPYEIREIIRQVVGSFWRRDRSATCGRGFRHRHERVAPTTQDRDEPCPGHRLCGFVGREQERLVSGLRPPEPR